MQRNIQLGYDIQLRDRGNIRIAYLVTCKRVFDTTSKTGCTGETWVAPGAMPNRRITAHVCACTQVRSRPWCHHNNNDRWACIRELPTGNGKHGLVAFDMVGCVRPPTLCIVMGSHDSGSLSIDIVQIRVALIVFAVVLSPSQKYYNQTTWWNLGSTFQNTLSLVI